MRRKARSNSGPAAPARGRPCHGVVHARRPTRNQLGLPYHSRCHACMSAISVSWASMISSASRRTSGRCAFCERHAPPSRSPTRGAGPSARGMSARPSMHRHRAATVGGRASPRRRRDRRRPRSPLRLPTPAPSPRARPRRSSAAPVHRGLRRRVCSSTHGTSRCVGAVTPGGTRSAPRPSICFEPMSPWMRWLSRRVAGACTMTSWISTFPPARRCPFSRPARAPRRRLRRRRRGRRGGAARPAPEHVHGLGINPADGALYVATHTGLFRMERGSDDWPNGSGTRLQDTMGFAVVGPDRFLGSGHPDLRDDLPPLLGLIALGRRRPLMGPRVAPRRGRLPRAPGARIADRRLRRVRRPAHDQLRRGRHLAARRPPAVLGDLVEDPSRPGRLVASSDAGVIRSETAGGAGRSSSPTASSSPGRRRTRSTGSRPTARWRSAATAATPGRSWARWVASLRPSSPPAATP